MLFLVSLRLYVHLHRFGYYTPPLSSLSSNFHSFVFDKQAPFSFRHILYLFAVENLLFCYFLLPSVIGHVRIDSVVRHVCAYAHIPLVSSLSQSISRLFSAKDSPCLLLTSSFILVAGDTSKLASSMLIVLALNSIALFLSSRRSHPFPFTFRYEYRCYVSMRTLA